MADVNRGNRPLSPHLTVYRPQWTSVLSIVHRMTGIGFTLGCVLIVLWLLAAATSAEAFALVDGLMTSWIGGLVMLGLTFALMYHTLNGIRHLFWDAGYGFDLKTAERTGMAVVVGACALTLLVLVVVVL
ncbi:MAG: succinate dehydrogenase, cytochrome b556 subunit [Pseudomonadota bacterium]